MNELNQLHIFTVVAQEMSFTRAALALGVSKSFASRAIVDLETRLATRLFERTTRNLELTEAGDIYLGYARRAMEEAQDGEAAVSKLREAPRGTLRVSMPVTLARSIIAPKLAQFLKSNPELRIEMTVRGGPINVIAQRVDVAFQISPYEADSQTIQKRVATVTHGIYAAKTYLSAAPPLKSLQDLTQHSCITLTTAREGEHWSLTTKDGKIHDIQLPGRVAVNDPVIHHRLCLDGLGIAIIPDFLAQEDRKGRRLVRVLPNWMPRPLEIYALYPTRLSMTPKLNAFLRFVESATSFLNG